jgi:PAS domain-containing protein
MRENVSVSWFMTMPRRFSGTFSPASSDVQISAFASCMLRCFRRVQTDRDIAKWQKNIAESEATLRESQLIAGVGEYVLDIPAKLWKSSEMLDQLFGIDDTYEHTVQGWEALVHPDDRTMMVDYLQNEVIVQGREFDKQFRIIRHNDQAERRVHALGRLEFDAFGHPLKLHGTLQDITEQKRAEEVVAESRNLLQTIIDAAPVRIFWKDQGLHYLGCNPSCASDAGAGAAVVVGALCQTLASSAGRWVLAPHDEAAAEQAWSSRDLLVGEAAAPQWGFQRGAVNHVIDRIFITAGCRWIIDYKTVHVPGEAATEPFLQARAEEYRGQLERYAKLFAGSDLPLRMAVFFPLQGILVELPHA